MLIHRQCCTDPTVVICSPCFNTQDHTGHSITMLVGQGLGGCCDCGDPEAFNPGAPRCGIHVVSESEHEDTPRLPQQVINSMKETIETALDFVIDVFSYLPLMAEDVDDFVCDSFERQSRLHYSCTSMPQESDFGDWIVVLYNDEVHTYPDVERHLKALDIVRFAPPNAQITATEVDTVGRAAIFKHPNLTNAIEAATKVMRTDLFCTVRTERDYTRETLAGYILDWIKTCISVGSCVGGDDLILRDLICQVLAAPWNMGIERADRRVELEDPDPLGPYMNAEWDVEGPCTDLIEERWYEEDYIRLDWILLFDCRYWKELRLSVRSIILGSLLGGKARVAGSAMDVDDPWGPRNWKRITGMPGVSLFTHDAGIRFARDFAQLCNLWIKYDREHHLTNTKLGVQIFTTPSIALELVERYHFLTHLLAIEYTYFTSEGYIGRPSGVDLSCRFFGIPDVSETDHWQPDSRILEIQEDIHHLLGNEVVKKMIPKRRDWIKQFLMFIELFHGIHAQTRDKTQHREFEGRMWEMALTVTSPLGRMMGYLSDGLCLGTREELQWAFRTCLEATFQRCLGMDHQKYLNASPSGFLRWHNVRGYDIVDFKVSDEPTSLCYPLNWMLSIVISQLVELDRDGPTDWDEWFPSDLPLEKRLQVGSLYYSESGLPKDSVQNVMVLTCADFPLRAIVMAAQIRQKWWARNGTNMYRQLLGYTYCSAYARYCADFAFLQWAFAVLPEERMLIQMLDRYDITTQLTSISPIWTHLDYPEDTLRFIIHEFFLTFLHLMNERDRPLGESAEFITRREIAHRLIFKKMRYSELQSTVRQCAELDIEDHFDTCLAEMAIFYPPTSSKPGTYELKKEYYSLVDPRHRSYTKNQTMESEKILIDQMAARGVPEPNRIVEPQERVLQPINGPFSGLVKVLGSPLFSRIVNNGILFAMEKEFESIVDEAVYLCLIAAMHPETKHSFMSNAKIHHHVVREDTNTTPVMQSLVDTLLQVLRFSRFSSLHAKIRHLFVKMRPLDPMWFDSSPEVADALSGMEDTAAAAEAELKKLVAKKRRDEMLNKMKLAQSKFQESHKDQLILDVSDDDDFVNIDAMDLDEENSRRKTFEFPRGNCILCQEKTTEDTPYGIPAMIHKHPLSRFTPLDNETFVEEAAMTPISLDVATPRPTGRANLQATRTVFDNENRPREICEKILGPGFPPQPDEHGYAVTTCSHVLHHKCWVSYMNAVEASRSAGPRNYPEHLESGEFVCPLCKSIANILIPIVWNDGVLQPVPEPVYKDLGLLDARHWLREFEKKVPSLAQESRVNAYLQARALDGDLGEIKFFFGAIKTTNPRREFKGQNRTMYQFLIRRLEAGIELPDRVDETWYSMPFLLAGTIAALEIAQRGTGDGFDAEFGPPVLGAISQQDLLLLRILASSSRSLIQYYLLPSHRQHWQRHFKKHYQRLVQLCCFRPLHGLDHELDSILYSDIFERFVIASVMMPFSFSLSISQLLLIHYLAEVTKTAIGLLSSPSAVKFMEEDTTCLTSPEVVPNFKRRSFIRSVATDLVRGQGGPSDQLLTNLYRLTMRYVTPFLRKAVIFVHVFENFVFPSSFVDTATPENQRLSSLLGLPSIEEIFNLDFHSNDVFFTMIRGWHVSLDDPGTSDKVIKLQHPAVFELIGLPHRLEALIEMASKFRCPKCRKVPDMPSMCLFCGAMVCAQAECCSLGSSIGEMNQHRKKYASLLTIH